jgi:hypothetical protein
MSHFFFEARLPCKPSCVLIELHIRSKLQAESAHSGAVIHAGTFKDTPAVHLFSSARDVPCKDLEAHSACSPAAIKQLKFVASCLIFFNCASLLINIIPFHMAAIMEGNDDYICIVSYYPFPTPHAAEGLKSSTEHSSQQSLLQLLAVKKVGMCSWVSLSSGADVLYLSRYLNYARLRNGPLRPWSTGTNEARTKHEHMTRVATYRAMRQHMHISG